MLDVSEESKAYRLYDIETADENKDIEAADENKDIEAADENKDIDAADENTAEENISSGSLAEATSPSSNKARNKRPPVWMRDYAIGEVFFCKEDDEAQPCLPLLQTL